MKGKETPVEVFDVMGEDDGSRFARAMRSEIAQVQDALGCFQQGALPAAAQHFTALGAALGLLMIATGRGGRRMRLPLGTFLGVGGLLVLLAGEPLMAWYERFFTFVVHV